MTATETRSGGLDFRDGGYGGIALLHPALALVVTMMGIGTAKFLVPQIPPTGIDDAAITLSYAQNIAAGEGFVYNVGGERVEGATSFLWTLILSVLFLFQGEPYGAALAVTGAMTFLAVWSAFGIARVAATAAEVPQGATICLVGLGLVGMPGFFMWSTWSLMEVGLWSALLLLLAYGLSTTLACGGTYGGRGYGVILAATLLPLVRPEGIAITGGLLGVAALLAGRSRWRGFAMAAGASLASFAALLAFRLVYFGQPWPNTFYAKVSADRLQTIGDGSKYVLSLTLELPYAELFLGSWAVLAVVALLVRWRSGRPLLAPAALIFGLMGTYAALGGDHFVLWRFLQPVAPLFPIPVAIAVCALWRFWRASEGVSIAAGVSLAAVGTGAALLPGWMHYYQSRFDIVKEFAIAERGLAFGRALDTVMPRPKIGVGPAGGVAIGYNGEILDLLGLNWTEMAHANPVKVGTRNLASFEPDVFWRHRPEIVAEFKRACRDGGFTLWSEADYYKGLYWTERFQAEYRPALFRRDGECWPVFAREDWLSRVRIGGLEEVDWNMVRLN
jgi:hypothetical protein